MMPEQTADEVIEVEDAETVAADSGAETGSDTAPPPVAAVDARRVLEAMLFASAEPLSMNVMRERLPEGADLGGMLMELQNEYKGRGVNLIELNGTWAFRTAADLGDALQLSKEVQRKLSRAAMETLSIIAYHQPVTRAEIENIRGVATHKGTLDVLIEARWVKPGRRRETPGRPLTWVTTTAFMDHFGLEALNDLPGLDEMKAAGLLDRRPAIETLGTGQLFPDEAMAQQDDAEDDDTHDDDNWEDAYEEAAPDKKEEGEF